jgi:hypothetical protein
MNATVILFSGDSVESMRNRSWKALLLLVVANAVVGCGSDDDDGLTPAQQHGVGAACVDDDDCFVGETAL